MRFEVAEGEWSANVPGDEEWGPGLRETGTSFIGTGGLLRRDCPARFAVGQGDGSSTGYQENCTFRIPLSFG